MERQSTNNKINVFNLVMMDLLLWLINYGWEMGKVAT
jgi:hypothetical protein